jgi:hypothetical protein
VESTVLGGVAAGTRRDTEGSLKKSHMHLFSNSQCLYFILGLGRATLQCYFKGKISVHSSLFRSGDVQSPTCNGVPSTCMSFFFILRKKICLVPLI